MKEYLLISTYVVAWLAFLRPIVLYVWKKWHSKVDFCPFNYCAIGFNEAGPVLDMLFSVTPHHNGIILNKVLAKITHKESGHTHNLEWVLNIGHSAFVNNQPANDFSFATAVAIQADESKSFCVRFADLKTNNKFSQKIQEFNKVWHEFLNGFERISSESDQDYIDRAYDAFRDQPVNLDFYGFVTDNFFWKEGAYEVVFSFHTLQTTYNKEFAFEFHISDEENKQLALNKASIITKRTKGEDNFFRIEKTLSNTQNISI